MNKIDFKSDDWKNYEAACSEIAAKGLPFYEAVELTRVVHAKYAAIFGISVEDLYMAQLRFALNLQEVLHGRNSHR